MPAATLIRARNVIKPLTGLSALGLCKPRHRYTQAVKNRVKFDRMNGMLLKDIAAKYGISEPSVWRITLTIQHKNRLNRSMIVNCRKGGVRGYLYI